jgi:prepilin-type N-terminal cleavage/methylation domain-containing protein
MIKLKKNLWRRFTLLEVIIAIAILAMGILAAMSMVSLSKKRMDKAYTTWFNEHLLVQAAEYYLLCGANKSILSDYFPYSGYSAKCTVTNCNDLSQDAVFSVSGNWKLVTYDISVRDPYGNILSQVKVDKIVKNEQISL